MENIMESSFFYTEIYQCQNCKSEIKMSASDTDKKCIFCGGQTVLKEENIEDTIMETGSYISRIRPDYILPFDMSKEEAKVKVEDYFGEFYKSKRFVVEKIKPIYVPYIIYDMREKNVDIVDYSGTGENQDHIYEKIPVNVSDKYNSDILQMIENFDLNYLIEFDEKIISDSYVELIKDITSMESKEYMEDAYVKSLLLKKYLENHSKYFEKWKRDFGELLFEENICCLKKEYALMPFWYARVEHRNKTFIILVNGQNGKVVGDRLIKKSHYNNDNETFIKLWTIFGGLVLFTLALLIMKPHVYNIFNSLNEIFSNGIGIFLFVLLFVSILLFPYPIAYICGKLIINHPLGYKEVYQILNETYYSKIVNQKKVEKYDSEM